MTSSFDEGEFESPGEEDGIGPSLLEPLPPESPAPPRRARPVSEIDRLLSLDVVRGLALFGILLVNIEDFSMPNAARYDPYMAGGTGALNHAIWYLTFHFADTKFIAMFTMLFGAGIALMDTRRSAMRERRAWAYYRRMVFLLGLGAAHGLFIWDGDILYNYAFCGLLVYFAPRIPAKVLLGVAALFILLDSVMSASAMVDMQGGYARFDFRLHQGDWKGLFDYRLHDWGSTYLVYPVFYLPQLLGFMLLGMALMKSGLLGGKAPALVYFLAAALAVPVGGFLVVWSTLGQSWFETGLDAQMFYWGSLILSLGYMSLTVGVCAVFPMALALRAVGAVGRMALTNYLMHSVIFTTLYYGYGFGLYGRTERWEQSATLVAVCVFQLIFSSLWLRMFRFGPVEWVWRSVTYLRLQPLRHAALSDDLDPLSAS